MPDIEIHGRKSSDWTHDQVFPHACAGKSVERTYACSAFIVVVFADGTFLWVEGDDRGELNFDLAPDRFQAELAGLLRREVVEMELGMQASFREKNERAEYERLKAKFEAQAAPTTT
jgi:hypothetical protein